MERVSTSMTSRKSESASRHRSILGRKMEKRTPVPLLLSQHLLFRKLNLTHPRNLGCVACVPNPVCGLLREPQDERHAREADVDQVSAFEICQARNRMSGLTCWRHV